MKSIILFIAAVTTVFTAFAQGAFNNVTLAEAHNRTELRFTATNNVNVRHYRIEAANSKDDFKVIATVASKTNSMRPTDYSVDLAGQDYTYYRVAKVAMDGSMPYSETVSVEKTKLPATQPINGTDMIVTPIPTTASK
ncbi:MAG: hypothetical protein H6551_08710 [Chitinophagales bacterium]|nr:hypothetical protein [Chitinophagaceae bacterium]MCB9065201.1 hypothetical protein [Chitinophagales bacterium]